MEAIKPFAYKSRGFKTHELFSEIKQQTHSFVFKNSTNRKYIVRVEKYDYELYILKFYPSAYEESPNKFNIIVNDNEARRIIFTCIEIMLEFYKKNNLASFAFLGVPTLQEKGKKRKKPPINTKRLRVYTYFARYYFSPEIFQHIKHKEAPFYLICNKECCKNHERLAEKIIDMLFNHYGDYN